ncbi:probable protein phosphatase 2C 14 [Lactuca sativa]|uniref:protein-serine/threonine phosphatase n=1 Tax=Lactuca sativa TaxID=4236 RepID=A0A9R1UUV0_LACSA|nr:probable protein phosphatase 2C 14 [Lactuca sativa]KAJ0193308.1 hypothetical protein LSAT_V11C800449970 [Lactuca sativa]
MPPSIVRLCNMNDGHVNVKSLEPFSVLTSLKKRKRPPMIEIPNVLQVIESAAEKFRPKSCESRSDVFSSSGFGVGVCSVKGRKLFMEDTHTIVSSSNTDKGFFGVYDGHGGRKAADFVAQNLHSNIFEMLEKSSGNTTTEEVIKAAFMKTDDEFLKQGLESGSCCVTAFIEGKELVVSNLGDCRAVLSRKGKAEALTKDHRASHEDERKRIQDKGGYVELHRGTWRVHGVLAVSRSIGDAHLKDWVLGEPETTILPLTDDLEYLILASDGLWDEVGNQEAVDMVTRCMRNISSKPKKVYRVKQIKQRINNNIINNKWKETENENENENEEPSLKVRRISHVDQVNGMMPLPCGLVDSCKELLNLAVSRGSLDDITVMILDLKAFN